MTLGKYTRQASARVPVTPGVAYTLVASAWAPGVQVRRRLRRLAAQKHAGLRIYFLPP